MIVGTILAAALLVLVSLVLLADACQPMSNLHVCDTGEPCSGHPGRQRIQQTLYGQFDFETIASPLAPEDRDGFLLMWASIREDFDADPCAAVLHADLLISDLMEDSQASTPTPFADPLLDATYQSAHHIAIQARLRETPIRQLKRAMDLFGVLFDELLGSVSGIR